MMDAAGLRPLSPLSRGMLGARLPGCEPGREAGLEAGRDAGRETPGAGPEYPKTRPPPGPGGRTGPVVIWSGPAVQVGSESGDRRGARSSG